MSGVWLGWEGAYAGDVVLMGEGRGMEVPGLMYPKQTGQIRSECRERSWKPS